MDEIQSINWFPGHMAKATHKIEDSLKLVDIVLEIIDARIPVSSRNPDINKITLKKPSIIFLNKSDLADPSETCKWIKHFKSCGHFPVELDCKSGKGLDRFESVVKNALKDKISLWKQKGLVGKTVKAMVVGIPNVGKSTFINKVAKKTRAKVENRPGVTRASQWFSVGGNIDLLDTPGVLWPRFDDQETGLNLAFTGAIKDEVVDAESLAVCLIKRFLSYYPKNLSDRFKIAEDEFVDITEYECLSKIARKRGMLIAGGEIDLHRVSAMVLEEFKNGKLGRITLERLD